MAADRGKIIKGIREMKKACKRTGRQECIGDECEVWDLCEGIFANNILPCNVKIPKK